jgi:hypothetical protein
MDEAQPPDPYNPTHPVLGAVWCLQAQSGRMGHGLPQGCLLPLRTLRKSRLGKGGIGGQATCSTANHIL